MANKLVFEVVVSDGGTAKITQKGIENVGKAAENVTRKTREAGKAQDELNYKLNQGTTGVSSAARSFSKLNQAIGSGPNGLVGAYATLAANAFAVSAAFSALREAAQVEQMMRGLEVQGARTGKNLAGLSKELQQLTNYSISAADAMQATALMSSAGFSSQGMKDLTTVANNAALALGRNVPDALDRISKGVTKLEPELLDELGIMTKLSEAQSAYALQTGKSVGALSSFEKRQAMLNAVVAEGTAKFGGLSDQVEANPYDQLAATFSDLTKNVLGFANSVLGPIARIFGSSQGMLLGGVILFVSSIKKQLMPALFEMSKNAAKARESHLAEAEAIKEKTAETLKNAKAMRDNQAIATRSKVGGIAGAALPKKFRVDEIKQGALSVKELNEELNRLDSSIRARRTGLEGRGAAPVNPAKVAQKEAELKLIEQERKNLAELIDLEANGETRLLPLRKEAREGRFKYLAATKLARAEELKSQSLEAAAAGNLREGWIKAKEAAQEYRRAVAAQGKADRLDADGRLARQGLMAKVSERVSGIAGTAGIFAQTAAAGFMKFLPYIGIATTALSGAWAVYKNFFQSEAEKAKLEALKKLKETLDNTAKSAKELARLEESYIIPQGVKTAQMLTIQSNATKQIADAFTDLKKAKADAEKTGKTDSFWKALIGTEEEAASYVTGISKGPYLTAATEELALNTGSLAGTGIGGYLGGALLGTLGSVFGPVGTAAGYILGAAIGGAAGAKIGGLMYKYLPAELNGVDEAALASLQSIDQLSRILDKDLYDSMVQAYGGAEKLASSEVLREDFIQGAARAYAGLADSIQELQAAFRSTGDAVKAFIANSIVKTSFDGLVDGFNSINKAFYNLDKSLAGSDLTKQFELMMTMPEDLQRTLSAPNRILIEQASTLNNELNTYKQRLEQAANAEYSNEAVKAAAIQSAQRQVDLAQQRYDVIKNTANTIRQELQASENTVRLYQEQERLAQQRLTLHNAIKNSEQDLYALSAEGEKRRIEMENEAVRLQQTQLKAQVAMLDVYMAKQRAALAEFDIQLQILRAQQGISREVAIRSAREGAAGVENYKRTILTQQATEEARVQLERSFQAIDQLVIRRQAAGQSLFLDASAVTIGGRALSETEQSYFLARQSQAVQEKTRDTVEARASTEEQLNALQQARSALMTSIAALDAQITNEETKQAKIAEVRTRLQANLAAIASDQADIATQNRTVEERINRILSGRNEIVADGMIASYRENSRAIDRLNQEKDAASAAINAQIAVIEARTLDNELKQASIQALRDQSTAEQNLFNEKIRQAQLTREQAVLEALVGDGIKGAKEKLQEVLELYQRRLDLAQQVQNQELQIAQNASKIRILRSGGQADERTQKELAVEAAEAAYQQAIAAYNLKVHSIKLEYDLLDAQKTAQAENLKGQAYMIKAMWEIMYPNREMSRTLQDTVDSISTAAGAIEQLDTSEMRRNAERQARNEVILARQNVEIAQAELENLDRGTRRGGAIANFIERMTIRSRRSDRSSQAENAPSVLPTDPIQLNFNVQRELLQAQLRAQETTATATQAMAATLAVPVASNDNTPQPSNTELTRQRMSMAETMSYAQRMAVDAGMKASEYGAQQGHAGEGHKEYRAIDVNIPGAGVEANNPEFKTRMDALARSYTEKGFVVLWNRLRYALDEQGKIVTTTIPESWGPHINHMHVEAQRAGVLMRREIVGGGVEAGRTLRTAVAEGGVQAAENARPPVTPTMAPNVTSMGAGFEQPQPPIPNPAEGLSNGASKSISIFEKLFGAIQTGMADSMESFDELSVQMSERLGQDFGPQGKILQALQSAMTEIPNAFETLSTSMKDIISSTANATRETVAGTGEAVAQATAQIQQNTEVVTQSQQTVQTGFQKTMDSAAAAFGAISSILGAIGSILKASSDAKIAGIDKEIAAEQKRDGKSRESLSRIEAMEKKKDAMARKQFNTQKKLLLAQAVMATAAGVAQTLAAPLDPFTRIALAAAIGAMGLAQVAIISGMQYESSATSKSVETPTTLSIGKRDSGVNLAMGPNASAGGEVGYLRGAAGTGTSASNYNAIGSAYGGDLSRGYGNRGFIVGEKGPELITPETPINVTPANENAASNPVNATINIQAIDSQGVQDVLVAQKGNIIQMLRQAANANGQRFLEDVNVNVYTRPSVGKLL